MSTCAWPGPPDGTDGAQAQHPWVPGTTARSDAGIAPALERICVVHTVRLIDGLGLKALYRNVDSQRWLEAARPGPALALTLKVWPGTPAPPR